MNKYVELLEKEINNALPKAMEFRKKIHMNPELGYKEFKTTDSIIAFLEEEDLIVNRFSNITGAIVNIDNGCEKTIGIRVDIDALPITENTRLDFTSKNEGIMHACGHDVHTSIGAGVAIVLNRLKDKLQVNVKIIFQPAEECSPNGGAKYLIEEGVLNSPDVSAMLGFHVWPEYKVGQIAIKDGPIMAASDKFKITINGKKSHAAQPHKGIDAIQISTKVLDAINGSLRRAIEPFEPFVISIGKINSKGRHNIICDYVELEGTIRTLNNETRNTIHSKMEELVKSIALTYGGKALVKIERGYDSVINDKEITQAFGKSAINVLGKENVDTNINSALIGEDFSFFSKNIPSTYFFLGCDSEYSLHNERFFPKEGTIEIGLKLISNFILNYGN